MKTPVRPKCAPTRVQRLRPEGPPLPRRQRPRRKPRKEGKSRKRRKHRDDARPRSANGKTAATKNGERLRNRRLNPKPRAGRPRSVKLDIKSNRRNAALQDDIEGFPAPCESRLYANVSL